MKKGLFPILLGAGLFLALLGVLSLTAGPKVYWHFSLKAFVHMPDTRAVEWAWVTLVEIDTTKAFPRATAEIKARGGTLAGTSLAFVRGMAWRSAYSYKLDDRCHDRPAQKTISWEASDSQSVYCGGQFFTPRPHREGTGRVIQGPDMFRLVFTDREVLHEDGQWEFPTDQSRVTVGALNVEGRPAVKTKGRFHLQEVNYRDELEYHESCGKRWAEQYLTAFGHFAHAPLEDRIPEVGQSVSGADNYGPHDKNQIIYYVLRSTSREHPHWGLKVEWAQPMLERQSGQAAAASPGQETRN